MQQVNLTNEYAFVAYEIIQAAKIGRSKIGQMTHYGWHWEKYYANTYTRMRLWIYWY